MHTEDLTVTFLWTTIIILQTAINMRLTVFQRTLRHVILVQSHGSTFVLDDGEVKVRLGKVGGTKLIPYASNRC
jgi:hypothetical protein